MSNQRIEQAFAQINDIDGQPLDGGKVYVGTAGLDASDNQITVYFDKALSSAATQPLTTKGGYIMNGSSLANLYTGADDYSIEIQNKNDTVVTSSLNVTDTNGGLQLAYVNGNVITTNTASGATVIKRGSAADTDAVLQLRNGSDVVVFNAQADNKVGLGMSNTAPFGNFQIRSAASGASSVSGNADELILEGSAEAGMTILAGTANEAAIHFGDSALTSQGQFTYQNASDSMVMFTANTRAITITSGQDVGIIETAPFGKLHVKDGDSGASSVSVNADELILENSTEAGMTILAGTGNEAGLYFGDSGSSTQGYIKYQNTGDATRIGSNNADALLIDSTQNVSSANDNTKNLGTASLRWAEVFAGNATINTSDEREKTVVVIDDKVLDAIDSVSSVSFKWNDAIEAKGDDARIHYGVLAQDVKRAFEDQGLDPFKYSVLCYDEWDAEYEQVIDTEGVVEELDKDGNVTTAYVAPTYKDGPTVVKEAGNRYGVRYGELHALKIACLERRIAALEV